MKLLVIGEKIKTTELTKSLGDAQEYSVFENLEDFLDHNLAFNDFDYLIDLQFDSHTERAEVYSKIIGLPILLSASKIQLAAAFQNFTHSPNKYNIVGVNFLPTFIDKPLWEMTHLVPENNKLSIKIENEFSKKSILVEDRVGMVTPRVIFMIINEACYTLQEGTAGIKEIDQAMKLGTNYPFGPFEWADKIGIKPVYEQLLAIYNDTKDERYKICPLLKTHYLKNQAFYSTDLK
jgi:3-hydroxybutyryl-CoA dehydrogenase